MRLLKIILVLFFTVGIIIPSCTDCDCLPIIGEYFDIVEIETNNLKSVTSGNPEILAPNAVVSFEDYEGLELKFIVEYHVNSGKCNSFFNFSTIPSLMACDCEYNGYLGSKEEMIKNFTVITLNNFSAQFSESDTLNSLLSIDYLSEEYSLDEYIVFNQNNLIKQEQLKLKLLEPPTSTEEFKIRVVLELTTGEEYVSESEPILITN